MMSSGQKWQKNGLYNIRPILDRSILIAMDVELEGKNSFIVQICVNYVNVAWKKSWKIALPVNLIYAINLNRLLN